MTLIKTNYLSCRQHSPENGESHLISGLTFGNKFWMNVMTFAFLQIVNKGVSRNCKL